MRQQTCETCGTPFTPTRPRQSGCPRHDARGREQRSPTTRAQDAEYAAERDLVLVPGAVCHWGCGRAATTVDHLIPVARGGRHRGNLVPACGRCNFSRQDRTSSPTLARNRVV